MKKKLFILFIYFFLYIKSSSTNKSYIFNSKKNLLNIQTNYTANNKKNVIVGVIENYYLNMILPFFKSFIKSNFHNCDVVIFVRYVPQIITDYLSSIGVIVHEIPNNYKNIRIINLRWKIYANFLSQNMNKYKLILHCDIRDTFFQKDIFKYYENQKSFLGVSLEDGTLNEHLNKKWIIDLAGDKIHKAIQNERIINIGSVLGTVDKFLEFSIYFWDKLLQNPNCIEQGIANYIFYYEKMFKNCLLKSDNYGPIMTLGLTRKEKIIIDSDDNILNFKGEAAAVIHQYDRKPELVKKVKNKYCPEIGFYEKLISNNYEYIFLG